MIKRILRTYTKWMGWHTGKRIVLIESDDWGTIRMPHADAYRKLCKKNELIENDPFSRYDALETAADLERLFDVLGRVKDGEGNHPIITANTIVANPDFCKIKESGFSKYVFEPFYKTIGRLSNGRDTLDLLNEGIQNNLFRPQLHGREHVHVLLWLRELRSGNEHLLAAFDQSCFGVPFKSKINRRHNLLAALDRHNIFGEEEFQATAVIEAAKIFKDYFGFGSISFIAPSYIWHRSIEQVLFDTGVMNLQGLSLQYEPNVVSNEYKKRLHYIGKRNALGQVYTTRNAFFEPSTNIKIDWVNECLKRIDEAFSFNKPAIISAHRLNFIGTLDVSNRDRNLKLFASLLNQMLLKWPDIQFSSSDSLGEEINHKGSTIKSSAL
jgi:hypothetical protein